MTAGDLAAYDAKERAPVCGAYRGYRICGMGPPSSGGTTVFAILKQLERFDLARLGPASPESWHLIAESMRLAYADRDKYLADADHVRVPVAGLIDPGYLVEPVGADRDRPDARHCRRRQPGRARRRSRWARTPVEQGTSHFVATDRFGQRRFADLDDRKRVRLGADGQRLLSQQ